MAVLLGTVLDEFGTQLMMYIKLVHIQVVLYISKLVFCQGKPYTYMYSRLS